MQTTLFTLEPPRPAPAWIAGRWLLGRYTAYTHAGLPGITVRHTGDNRCLRGYWIELAGESVRDELGTFCWLSHAKAVATVLSQAGLEAAREYVRQGRYREAGDLSKPWRKSSHAARARPRP